MRAYFALFVFLGSGFSLLPTCFSNEGGCSIRATYYSSMNTTYWTAACDDGFVTNGALGGDATSYICSGY